MRAAGAGPPGADATVDRPARVLVYGSCVTRDMFELTDPTTWTLAGYVARQSVISAMGRLAPADLAAPGSLSPFQARMLEADLRSTLPATVRRLAPTVDLVLWDLTDERLGVYRLADGSYVTRSVELVASGLDRTLQRTAEHLPLGGPEHLALWRQAADGLVAALRSEGLPVAVVAVPWAVRSDDGSAVPSSFGLPPEEANRLLEPYHRHLTEGLGLPSVAVPDGKVVAAADHRWGPAPFHYTRNTYELLRGSLDRLRGELR